MAGIILGLQYSECTIDPGTGSDGIDYMGRTDFDFYDYVDDDPSPQRVRNAVVPACAGIEAERFFFGEPSKAGWCDVEDVKEILQYYGANGVTGLGSSCEEEAKGRCDAFALISHHCATVRRVALLLLKRKTVTYEEVKMEIE